MAILRKSRGSPFVMVLIWLTRSMSRVHSLRKDTQFLIVHKLSKPLTPHLHAWTRCIVLHASGALLPWSVCEDVLIKRLASGDTIEWCNDAIGLPFRKKMRFVAPLCQLTHFVLRFRADCHNHLHRAPMQHVRPADKCIVPEQMSEAR